MRRVRYFGQPGFLQDAGPYRAGAPWPGDHYRRHVRASQIDDREMRAGHAAIVQALYGMGGVGEAQLAVDYAHRFAECRELYVVVGDQGPLDRCADHPVVPDAGVEREQSLDDAGPEPGRDTAAVAFQAELVLQRPDDCLHALAQPIREAPRLLLVLAGRADQGQAQLVTGEEILGLLARQALVGDDGGAGGWPLRGLEPKYLPGFLPLAVELGVGQPEAR